MFLCSGGGSRRAGVSEACFAARLRAGHLRGNLFKSLTGFGFRNYQPGPERFLVCRVGGADRGSSGQGCLG